MDAPKNKQSKQDRLKYLCELPNMANEENATDVLGSYTGMGQHGDEPEQDADDL